MLTRGQGAQHAAAPWYVVQVQTGREETLCRLIERVAPEGSVVECFTPRFATQNKRKGAWETVERPLLPGYVIVATREIARVRQALAPLPEFARVLSMGESFVPLDASEQEWICAFTRAGERCVPMSTGVVEGDRVRVVDGPLVGREALIKSVNRHRSIAFVEFEICGRTVVTKLGLSVLAQAR